MSEATFQVIAATPQRSPDEVAELADRIGDLFDVDLGSLLSALARTGVSVATAASLAEARAKGAKIIGVGADYRVLDGAGKQVDAGEAKGRVQVAPQPPSRSSRTMMGMGSHLIGMAAERPELEDEGGFLGANSSVAEGAVEVDAKEEEIELEDSGGFAAIDSSVAEGGLDVGEAAEAEPIAIDDTGGVAFADSSIAEGAIEIAASAQKIELEDTSGGFASAQPGVAAAGGIAVPSGPDKVELEGPGGFVGADAVITDDAVPLDGGEKAVSLPIPPPVLQSPPPAEGGFNLESLDGDALMMLDGTDDQPETSEDEAQASAVDESSFLPPEEDELDMDALDIAVPSPSPPAEEEAPAAEEPAMAPILGEVVEVPVQAPTEAPLQEEAIGGQTRPPQAATASAKARPTSQRRASRRGGSFALLGGWFGDRPRIRVVVGFLAALMLASLLPICHARSIRTDRIEELRIDLATAKAHGAAVAGNRTPSEIEASISSLQTRHTIYALAMWCALMALFLFLWFRFT